jgi:hypothetical protein
MRSGCAPLDMMFGRFLYLVGARGMDVPPLETER